MDDLKSVSEFRNRLVAYMNLVVSAGTGLYSVARDPDEEARIRSEQPWLAQEYGRLYKVINRWGGMMMASPALGVTSRDVIQDAIHNIDSPFGYGDLARLSVQHLDTVIGRLRGEAEQEAEDRRLPPEAIYRLTSPVFWIQQLASGVRWVLATNGRRIAAIVGTLLLAVITAFVSGWAQALFAQH